MAGIKKSRTTPAHPAGNGQYERFNSTLLGMLGTLNDEQKVNWKNYVAPLVHALVLCLLLAFSAVLEAVLYANCNLFSNCRAYDS
jgi:multisubunit Na+/H+ antiporter MnhC subunit